MAVSSAFAAGIGESRTQKRGAARGRREEEGKLQTFQCNTGAGGGED